MKNFANLEADSASLCFNSHDDALSHASKLVEDSARWLAVHELDIANSYIRADVEIHVVLSRWHDAKEFHLVFLPIPNGVHNSRPRREGRVLKVDASAKDGDGADDRVFVGVTELVKCPQGVVPSFVWLERADEVNDFFGHVLESSLYGVVKMRLVGPDWEESVLQSRDGEYGLIQGIAKVASGVGDDAFQSTLQSASLICAVRLLLRSL